MARRRQYIFAEESHRGRSVLLVLLMVLTLIFAALFTVNFVMNHSVAFTRQVVTLASLPADLESFSILHLSDLNGHYVGDGQSAVRKAIGSRSISCVVLSGNMVGPSGDVEPLLSLVKLFPSGTPILLLPGDGDPSFYATAAHGSLSPYQDWVVRLQDAGVTVLDEPVCFTRGKAKIWFVPENLYSLNIDGTEAAYQDQLDGLIAMGDSLTPDQAARKRSAEFHVARMQRIRESIASISEKDVQVVVSHMPLTSRYISEMRLSTPATKVFSMHNVSLVLSGGYCGGQWRLPGVGAVYVPELGFFPEDEQIMGLGYLGGVWQYISPGLAASSDYPFMPFRLFNSPGAALLVLTSSLN